MSLSANKSALFGKGSGSTPSTIATSGSKPSAKLSGGSSSSSSSTISPAVKAKKIAEAEEWNGKGNEHLKKSVFKWTPDHLAAAPCFEKASTSYKLAGELDLARQLLVKSAESNEIAGCSSAAANNYCKAAEIAHSNNRFDQSASHYQQSSELYGINGDLDKSAEMLAKAAKEVRFTIS